MSAKEDITIPLLPNNYYHIFNRGNNKGLIFFREDNFYYFLKKYHEKTSAFFDKYAYCLLDNHFHLVVRVKDHQAIFETALKAKMKTNNKFFRMYVTPWLERLKIKYGEDDTDLITYKNVVNIPLNELVRLFKIYGDTLFADPAVLSEDTNCLHNFDFGSQLASFLVSEKMRGFLLGYAKAINVQQKRTGSLFQKTFKRKLIADTDDYLKTAVAYVHHNPIHHNYTKDYIGYAWSSYKLCLNLQNKQISEKAISQVFDSNHAFCAFHESYKISKVKNLPFMYEEEF